MPQTGTHYSADLSIALPFFEVLISVEGLEIPADKTFNLRILPEM